MSTRVRRLAVLLPLVLAGCGAAVPGTAANLATRPIVMSDTRLSGELQPTATATLEPATPVAAVPAPSPTIFPSSSARPYSPPPSPQSETAEQAQQRGQQIQDQIVAADKQLRTVTFRTS